MSIYPFKAVIVRYSDDTNTKYTFSEIEHISIYYKDDIDLDKFVDQVKPFAIISAGWADNRYNGIARKFNGKIATILTMDNPWYGTIKQRIFCNFSSFVLGKMFSKIWVTGYSQYEYASRLGFAKQDIHDGLYAADVERFNASYLQSQPKRKEHYPQRFVFVGRLVAYKQPLKLAKIFQKVVDETKLDWKLIIAGEGPLKSEIQDARLPNVELVDFVSPEQLPEFYKDAGIFCLPSSNEHWGVAVHEAAAAGLPLLLSDSVASASQFLINDFNGYTFRSNDDADLASRIRKILTCDPSHLFKMGENSALLSRRVTHETWSAQLNSMLQGTNQQGAKNVLSIER